MTIVAHTDEKGAHRLEASLEKLVDVLLAENISERSVLERDLALLKVAADQQSRPHLMELIKVFRGRGRRRRSRVADRRSLWHRR